MKILVTGGAGYIGSHTCVELLEAGYEVVIVDNFCNSNPKVIERIRLITGKKPNFYEADIADEKSMTALFEKEQNIECVIHFAGLKAVGESVAKPLEYYSNNIGGTLTLLKVMKEQVRLFMASQRLFRLRRTVRKHHALILMLGRKICRNRFLRI